MAEADRTWANLRADRNLLFMDDRGIGRSTPFVCDGITEPDALGQGGNSPEAIAACLESNRDVAPWMRTDAAADDLEALRIHLDLGAIDVWGGSYGSVAAQVYVARHPSSVRTAVLDSGPTIGEDPMLASIASWPMRAMADRCRTDDCGPQPEATWTRAVERALEAGAPDPAAMIYLHRFGIGSALTVPLLDAARSFLDGNDDAFDDLLAMLGHGEADVVAEFVRSGGEADLASTCDTLATG